MPDRRRAEGPAPEGSGAAGGSEGRAAKPRAPPPANARATVAATASETVPATGSETMPATVPATGFTVFLDRDGVFNRHPPLAIRKWEQFHWLEGAKQAFSQLNRPDVRTCLCTNQPTVGMLWTTPGMVHHVNRRMQEELARAGGDLHHMEAAFAPWWLPHRRRKPRPGMLEDGAAWLAAHGWEVDKAKAVMVGDKPKDAMAGNAFGVPAILLATTHDASYLADAIATHGLDAVVASGLPQAVEIILRRIEKA